MEIRGQLLRVGSLLPPCEYQRPRPGHRAPLRALHRARHRARHRAPQREPLPTDLSLHLCQALDAHSHLCALTGEGPDHLCAYYSSAKAELEISLTPTFACFLFTVLFGGRLWINSWDQSHSSAAKSTYYSCGRSRFGSQKLRGGSQLYVTPGDRLPSSDLCGPQARRWYTCIWHTHTLTLSKNLKENQVLFPPSLLPLLFPPVFPSPRLLFPLSPSF